MAVADFADTSVDRQPAPSVDTRSRHLPTTSRKITVDAKLLRRLGVLLLGAVALAIGLFSGAGPRAAELAAADPDLARLLKAMTAIKAVMALAVTGAVLLRAGAETTLKWGALYTACVASMWAGVGVMWHMQFMGFAAVAMHVGLFGAIVLFFRDPTVDRALARALFWKAARR
ncbi:MAG: hypothetical protein AAF668_11015 [Pseudomonadota bacterium]